MISYTPWMNRRRLIALFGAVVVAIGMGVAAVAIVRSGEHSTENLLAQPAAPMPPIPQGSFGTTEGANVEIAPGVVTRWVKLAIRDRIEPEETVIDGAELTESDADRLSKD